MQIANSADWAGWQRVGDVNVVDGVATATSPVGSSSRLSLEMAVNPGMTVELCVWARITSGDLAGNGALAINQSTAVPGADPIRKTVLAQITSTEWRPYRVRYSVPVGATVDDYIRCSVGVFTDGAGTIEVRWPSIDVVGGSRGAPRVLAMGLIGCEAGAWSLTSSYRSVGIHGLSWAGTTLTVTTDRVPVIVGAYPVSSVTKTANGPAAWRRLLPTVGSYSAPDGVRTGSLQIRFVDPATGDFADAVAALAGGSGYLNLMSAIA